MNRNKKNISYAVISLLLITGLSIQVSAQDPKRDEQYMRALNYEQNNEPEKAKEIYLEMYKSQQTDINSFSALNRIYVRLKEYDSSIKLVEERLKNSPEDFNLYGMLGSTYYAKGETEKAFDTWDKGIAVQPKSIVPYRAICSYAIQNKAYEKAIDYYLRGEAAIKKKGIFTNEIFNLYNVLFKFGEAAAVLCETLITQPEYIGIGKSAMYAYASRTDVHDKFIEVVSNYLAKAGKTVFKEFLAFIYQLKGESKRAFELIKEIEEANKSNGNSIFNFAHECFAGRSYQASSIAFKYIIDNFPKGPFAIQSRVFYPQALELMIEERTNRNSGWKTYSFPDTINNGEYSNIIKIYEENIKLYPNPDIRMDALLRMGLIQKEMLLNYDTAEKSFNQIIQGGINSPYLITSYEKLAELNLLKSNFGEAEKLCNNIIQASFADSLSKRKANFILGKSFYWQGSFNKALENLKEVTYDFSNDLSNDAIEVSAIINASKKDSLLLLDFAKADYLIFKKDFTNALELLKKTAQSDNMILNDAARYQWAMVLLALNRPPEALKILEEIYSSGNSNYPDNAYFSSGNIYYYELNDFRSAKEKFEKLLEVFPGSILADRAREMLNIIKNKLEKGNDNKPNRQ